MHKDDIKKLLIVIPYRDREKELQLIIPHIKIKLDKQNIQGDIVVVEQNKGKLFNRGLICNIGFKEFGLDYNYTIFHDVDLICDNIDYSYNNTPTSLLSSRTKHKNLSTKFFGGITLFPNQDFIKINGFSNKYWGWGAEDDDLYLRCYIKNIKTNNKSGICKDLELIPDNIKQINNVNYKSNLILLRSRQISNGYNISRYNIEWDKRHNITESDYELNHINFINEDGLNSCGNFYSIESTINKQNYIHVKAII